MVSEAAESGDMRVRREGKTFIYRRGDLELVGRIYKDVVSVQDAD